MTEPLIIIVSGPGGAGKGTIVDELVRQDDALWLSRSWTTRPRRDGESEDAYVFVTRDEFERRIAGNGFLEWTEFLGNLYGSPMPERRESAAHGSGVKDIVLEIELHGAQQVKQQHPDALLVFVMPPSREEQQRRLQGRGDPQHHVEKRLKKAEDEEKLGGELADLVIVNDDLGRAVAELRRFVGVARAARR